MVVGVVVRNEDYIQIRVPASEFSEVMGRLGKTFAYRRLSARDGSWGLVWDLKVHQDLDAVLLEREALVAALRHATRLLSPSDAGLVRSTYRERLGA